MFASNRLRQAATLLKSIPDSQADKILERLPSRDLRSVIHAMRELDSISEGQLFEALQLFAREASCLEPRNASAQQRRAVQEMMQCDPLEERSVPSYFSFLLDYSAGQVARLLNDEHPKSVATVLSNLPSEFASDILASLDPIVRVSTLKRFCDAETASDHELSELNIALHKRAVRCCGALPCDVPSEFEDLARLTDREWQTLLAYVDTSCWAPALKTAPRGLRERVFSNLGREPKRLLLAEIEQLVDFDQSQAEATRSKILETCQILYEAGQIALRRM